MLVFLTASVKKGLVASMDKGGDILEEGGKKTQAGHSSVRFVAWLRLQVLDRVGGFAHCRTDD